VAGGDVHHEGHLCGLPGVSQGGGGGEGILGCLEGVGHVVGPGHRRLQRRAAHQGVVEGPEDGGSGGDEPAVKINSTKECHELLDGTGPRMQLVGGEAAEEGGDAGGGDVVSQEV